MATKQLTLTATTVLTKITIDPVGAQLYLEGVVQIPDGQGGQVNVLTYSENVTALLNQSDKDAATQLVTRAQAWIDAKMP